MSATVRSDTQEQITGRGLGAGMQVFLGLSVIVAVGAAEHLYKWANVDGRPSLVALAGGLSLGALLCGIVGMSSTRLAGPFLWSLVAGLGLVIVWGVIATQGSVIPPSDIPMRPIFPELVIAMAWNFATWCTFGAALGSLIRVRTLRQRKGTTG